MNNGEDEDWETENEKDGDKEGEEDMLFIKVLGHGDGSHRRQRGPGEDYKSRIAEEKRQWTAQIGSLSRAYMEWMCHGQPSELETGEGFDVGTDWFTCTVTSLNGEYHIYFFLFCRLIFLQRLVIVRSSTRLVHLLR
jgi:hypothetical protein